MIFTDQAPYDVRFDWGTSGLNALRDCRTFVIVDVLSFSTCVSVAVDRGAAVLPFRFDRGAAGSFALQQGAILAERRGAGTGYSLSPRSLHSIPPDARLVLPSPNGSTLSELAEKLGMVIAGCLRNRTAVAQQAAALGGPIAVIAAGEQWPDGSLRPNVEDLWGAGAIIAALSGQRSPEARAAAAAFLDSAPHLETWLLDSASGRELTERGFTEDVRIAADIDASTGAPVLVRGAFQTTKTSTGPRLPASTSYP